MWRLHDESPGHWWEHLRPGSLQLRGLTVKVQRVSLPRVVAPPPERVPPFSKGRTGTDP